jgi:hypothetical protein
LCCWSSLLIAHFFPTHSMRELEGTWGN